MQVFHAILGEMPELPNWEKLDSVHQYDCNIGYYALRNYVKYVNVRLTGFLENKYRATDFHPQLIPHSKQEVVH